MEMPWPEHPAFPSVGYVITRHDLDQLVAERAAKAGATVWEGAEAIGPILDPATAGHVGGTGPAAEVLPSCAGAKVLDRDTRDDSTRSGPATWWSPTGPTRASAGPSAPPGTGTIPWAWRCGATSARRATTSAFIESHLDIRDASGRWCPGYGWVFPLGDGRVNAGVGLLSVEGRWKGVNTTQLMDAFIDWAPASWGLSPTTLCGPPTGGKLPMGLSVRPRIGPNVLAIGDAAGSINPFNGEGIAYGYETGRLAAACVARALSGEGVARPRRLRGAAPGGLRPLLPGGPRVRPADQPARADAGSACAPACTPAASWNGCCASWPTWCAPTSSARPRPPTGRCAPSAA